MTSLIVTNAAIVQLNRSFGIDGKIHLDVYKTVPPDENGLIPAVQHQTREQSYSILAQWSQIVVSHVCAFFPKISISPKTFINQPLSINKPQFYNFDKLLKDNLFEYFANHIDYGQMLETPAPSNKLNVTSCPYANLSEGNDKDHIKSSNYDNKLREISVSATLGGLIDGSRHAAMVAEATFQYLTTKDDKIPTPSEFKSTFDKTSVLLPLITQLHILPFLLTDMMIRTGINPYVVDKDANLCIKPSVYEFIGKAGMIYKIVSDIDGAALSTNASIILANYITNGIKFLHSSETNGQTDLFIEDNTFRLFLDYALYTSDPIKYAGFNSVISCPATLSHCIGNWIDTTKHLIYRWYTCKYFLSENSDCLEKISKIITDLRKKTQIKEVAEKYAIDIDYVTEISSAFMGEASF